MTHILIVDDDPTQAKEFGLLLEGAGCEVSHARDGGEALATLRRGLPDVVLTDLEMPGIDGLQLVKAIRHDYPALPVILMTAMGGDDAAVKVLRHGAASYVRKGNLAREIVRTVGSVLAVARSLPQQRQVLECLEGGQFNFVLGNDLAHVTAVLSYLQQVAAIFHPCDSAEQLRIGMALNEALVNAIQHGNLELSSDLRQEDEAIFRRLGDERRLQLPYLNRRVRLIAALSRSEAVYVIEDEGQGFNPSLVPDPTAPSQLKRIGGRGLLLIRAFMDHVEHNAKGNRITLRKDYSTPDCSAPADSSHAES